MKNISIHQPHYHNWLGLLHKIACSDEHIILDDVQFRKRNFQNRARISTDNGEKLLTVPVLCKGYQNDQLHIKDVMLAEPFKLNKQFKSLQHAYGKSPGWPIISGELEAIYSNDYKRLIDLNVAILTFSLELFDIKTPISYSSALKTNSQKSDKILEICIAKKATGYICGQGAKNYMNELSFKEQNIQVIHQNFIHPIYPQKSNEWIPGCIVFDSFCFHPEETMEMVGSFTLNELDKPC